MKIFNLIIILLLFVPGRSWGFGYDEEYVPIKVRNDFNNYMDHINDADQRPNVKRLEKLYRLVSDPTEKEVNDDRMRWLSWRMCTEYWEFKAALELCLASVYQKVGDEERYYDMLPAYEGCASGYLGDLNSSMLTDFICAIGGFHSCGMRLEHVIKAHTTYDSRVGIITGAMRSYAALKRCVSAYPYDCMSHKRTLHPSNDDATNVLLWQALKLDPVPGVKAALSKRGKSVHEVTENLLKEVPGETCTFLMQMFEQFKEIPFVLKYAFDAAADRNGLDPTMGKREYDLTSQSIYFVLSELKYGPADFQLGLLAEEKKEEKNAALHYFKAYLNGDETAKIRAGWCYAMGMGIDAQEDMAFRMLSSMIDHQDFPKYGAYAYAYLMTKGHGGGTTDKRLFLKMLSMAAAESSRSVERKNAMKLMNELYEKYYE